MGKCARLIPNRRSVRERQTSQSTWEANRPMMVLRSNVLREEAA
jgi:hypothetical protein